ERYTPPKQQAPLGVRIPKHIQHSPILKKLSKNVLMTRRRSVGRKVERKRMSYRGPLNMSERIVPDGIALLAATILAAGCGGGTTMPGLPPPPPLPSPMTQNVVRISADPFTNGTSQHATQV